MTQYDIPSNTRYDVEREECAEEYDLVDWCTQSAQDPKSAAKIFVSRNVSSGDWDFGKYTIHVHHDGETSIFTVQAYPSIDVWVEDPPDALSE